MSGDQFSEQASVSPRAALGFFQNQNVEDENWENNPTKVWAKLSAALDGSLDVADELEEKASLESVNARCAMAIIAHLGPAPESQHADIAHLGNAAPELQSAEGYLVGLDHGAIRDFLNVGRDAGLLTNPMEDFFVGAGVVLVNGLGNG